MPTNKILLIFIFSLIIRGVYVALFFDPSSLAVEDQALYLNYVQQWIASGSFVHAPDRSPVYLLILYLFFLVSDSLILFLLIQGVVDSLTCVVTAQLTNILFGRYELTAGFLAALNLNMVILSSMILTDSFFLFAFAASLLFWAHYFRSGNLSFLVIAVVLLAGATMIRSITLYLLPISIVLVMWKEGDSWNKLSKPVSRVLLASLIIVSILSFQYAKNLHSYQAWGFVSQGGTHLLGWVVPGVIQYSGRGTYSDGQALARTRLEDKLKKLSLDELPQNPFVASEIQTDIAIAILRDLGPIDVAKAWLIGAVLNGISPSIAFAPPVRAMDRPSFYMTPGDGVVSKLVNYIKDSKSFLYLLFIVSGTVISLLFIGFFIYGLWLAFREKLCSIFFLALAAAAVTYFFAITGPVIGSKYRLPIEPLATVFATLGLIRFAVFFTNRNR